MKRAALITGASTGIGYELVKCFARDGHDVVLVARNEAKLGEVASEIEEEFSVAARVMPADLSDAESPGRLFDALDKDGIEVDYLVNNAGFGSNGKFAEADLASQLSMIEVNVTALVHLTGLFLPKMLERGRGRVMNLASTASFQANPMMAVYGATKAFVLSFSEAVSNEIKDSAVTVTAVCPGATHTEFQSRADCHGMPFLNNPWIKVMSAKEVAQMGYRGFMNGQGVVVTGLLNFLGTQSVRFVPRSLVAEAARRMIEIPK